MNMQTLALAFLAATAIGGLAWVFIYPLLSGETEGRDRAAPRSRAPSRAGAPGREEPALAPRAGRGIAEGTRRPAQEGEVRPAQHPPRPGRADPGRPQKFWIVSGILGAVGFVLAFLVGGGLLGAAGMAFAAGLGLPRWVLGFLKKRREKAFLKALPDAVDVIVRGIKAGLPLFESIKVVAADAPEPLKSEFNAIIETQTIGMPLGEACARLYERMPLPEANFFGIVIAIQQKSGGNLSEALGNLSQGAARPQEDDGEDPGDVDGSQGLRRHHRLAAADRDAAGLDLRRPTTSRCFGPIRSASSCWSAASCWMSIGILVMKKMINFDF